MVQQLATARIGLALLAAVVTFAACDDGGSGTRTGQLTSSPSAALAVRVSPFQLQLAPTPRAGCPMSQPFMLHFDLVIGPASIDFFVDTVTLRFGDGASPVLFTTDDLDRLFGTRHVPPHTSRVFSMNPEFGCGFSTTPRSLLVTTTLFDGHGRRHEATATATIR